MPGTDDAPRSPGSGGPTCEFLSIGTLVPRKGHDLLLRALARLFDLDWHLTIVGSPRAIRCMRRRACRAGGGTQHRAAT
jgi:glycosyltransferase involved in cell wall biosynthesis